MNKKIIGVVAIGIVIIAAVVAASQKNKNIPSICYNEVARLERLSFDVINTKDGNMRWYICDGMTCLDNPKLTELAPNKYLYENSTVLYATSKHGTVMRYRDFYKCEVTNGKPKITYSFITTIQIP